MKLKNFFEAKESALRLLARRDYGFHELKQRLRKGGFEEPIISQVLEALIELDLQNDERFAESYVRRRVAKGFGPLHISNELIKLQITEHLIQREIGKYSEEWQTIIKQLYLKKFGKKSTATSSLKEQSKHIRFFQSRGFSFTLIKEALSPE
ncbi:MAG: regulatory protein RecX [Gammaproteobacteria bacterium]|nr:regulatory protein RecX [Gammaproteobacteria bacterium]